MGEEDARVVRVAGDVALVLDGGGEGEDVLLELQADELLAADVAERLGAGGVGVVPRLVDLLGEVVNPAAVRGGEGEGGAQGGGGDGDGVVVEVDEDVAVAVALLEEEGVGAAYDVGLCAEVGEDVELLEGGVGAEEAALAGLSVTSIQAAGGVYLGGSYLAKDLQGQAHVLE